MTLSRRQFIATAGCVSGATLSRSTAGAAQARPFDPERVVDGSKDELVAQGGLSLTLACANYIRFMPIAAGDVRPTELALTWVRGDRTEMLRRATDDPAIDGGESSMAQHVMRLDRGDRSLVAVPVFPLRNFTVQFALAHRGRGRRGAADGRRLSRARPAGDERQEPSRRGRVLPVGVRGRSHQTAGDGR